MVKRVVATEAALALIERMKAKHGAALMFFQSAGCCDGSSPMCYLIGELTVGRYDLLLGEIGGCQFFISQSHYEYWKHTQLIIDVTQGGRRVFHHPLTPVQRRGMADPAPAGLTVEVTAAQTRT